MADNSSPKSQVAVKEEREKVVHETSIRTSTSSVSAASGMQQERAAGGRGTSQYVSRVNGQGIWKAWKRNFKSPLLALLDLFDNAIDASLVIDEDAFNFKGRGRIHVMGDKDAEGVSTGISIISNCHNRIPPIKEVLEVFKSSKGSQAIGENGVGMKQACATLTDLSFIMTRNRDTWGLGVITAEVQRVDGIVLPSITFRPNREDLSRQVKTNPAIAKCVSCYGDGDFETGIMRLLSHCNAMTSHQWRGDDHVFLVVLHQLRHGSESLVSSKSSDNEGDTDYGLRAQHLMHKLTDELPRQYLHIPAEFDFTVNHQKIRFQHWERRLVEITSFRCKVDPQNEWSTAEDWENPTESISLCVYCGFDPARLDGESSSSLSLYVHSRHSGRLITVEPDARNALGLNNFGTTFGQGLTVILDDYMSTLPLHPTKQGLAFAQHPTGVVFEKNLFAWLGAYASLYYNRHLEKFGGSKGELAKGVQQQLQAVQRLRHKDNVKSFMCGTFTCYDSLSFKRYSDKSIRKSSGPCKVTLGADSLVNLDPPRKLRTPSKRLKSTSDDSTLSPARATLPPASRPRHVLMENSQSDRSDTVAVSPDNRASGTHAEPTIPCADNAVSLCRIASLSKKVERDRERKKQCNSEMEENNVDKTCGANISKIPDSIKNVKFKDRETEINVAIAAATIPTNQVEEERACNDTTSHENQPSLLENMEENNDTISHDPHAEFSTPRSKRETPYIMMHCRMGHDDSIVILNDSTAQDGDGYSPQVRRLLEELEQASRVMVGWCAATYLVGIMITLRSGVSMYCYSDSCSLRGPNLGGSNNSDVLMTIYRLLLVLAAVYCFQCFAFGEAISRAVRLVSAVIQTSWMDSNKDGSTFDKYSLEEYDFRFERFAQFHMLFSKVFGGAFGTRRFE